MNVYRDTIAAFFRRDFRAQAQAAGVGDAPILAYYVVVNNRLWNVAGHNTTELDLTTGPLVASSAQIETLGVRDTDEATVFDFLVSATRRAFHDDQDVYGYAVGDEVFLDLPAPQLLRFYGNAAGGYDRLPVGLDGDPITEDITRTDYSQEWGFKAISPYWDGYVLCEVPEGCDFSVEPPIVVPGFRIIGYAEGRGPNVYADLDRQFYPVDGKPLRAAPPRSAQGNLTLSCTPRAREG